MKKGDILFVYGSLRKGETADLSRNLQADFLGSDRINGELYAVSWYPGVKANKGQFDPDKPAVIGDLFRIRDDRLVVMLDAYEGYPDLFTRIETTTEAGNAVWVYVYGHEVEARALVPSGDWRQRVTQNPTLSL